MSCVLIVSYTPCIRELQNNLQQNCFFLNVRIEIYLNVQQSVKGAVSDF